MQPNIQDELVVQVPSGIEVAEVAAAGDFYRRYDNAVILIQASFQELQSYSCGFVLISFDTQ